MEQDLKMRQLKDLLNKPETKKEDIITVFLALQRQCFALSNTVSNLVKQWPSHPLTMAIPGKSEISSENRS